MHRGGRILAGMEEAALCTEQVSHCLPGGGARGRGRRRGVRRVVQGHAGPRERRAAGHCINRGTRGGGTPSDSRAGRGGASLAPRPPGGGATREKKIGTAAEGRRASGTCVL
jgi:hypothetical protein